MRTRFLFVVLICLVAPSRSQAAPDERYPEFQFRRHKEEGGVLPYRLLVPRDVRPGQSYPLVIWLHGSGEKGTNNRLQLHPPLSETFLADAARTKHPCFVMVPQCPSDASWTGVAINKAPEISEPSRMILATIAELQKEFTIDARRISIGGFSMGGFGTWDLVVRRPSLFAAAFPISGTPPGWEKLAPFIKDVPLWVFHGEKDPMSPVAAARQLVAALRKAGSPVKYTEYRGAGHNCGNALAEPELLDWLFSRQRPTPGTFTPADIPADAWPILRTLPPGTHGTWTGKVQRTLHHVPRLAIDGVRYRLRPAAKDNKEVTAVLDGIGEGRITGECRVTGTVQVDRYVWIVVEDIEVR